LTEEEPLRQAIRNRLTYANVMATLAVFIALGGSSYAALRIGSKEIRNNSVRSKDVRNRSLTGSDVAKNRVGGGAIKESTLGQVPSAGNADRVGGRTAEELRVKCPAGTVPGGGVCIEENPSPPLPYGIATDQCIIRGRSLPTYGNLRARVASGQFPLAPGGEFTSNVYEGSGNLRVVILSDPTGSAVFQDALTPAARSYRCIAPLTQ